MGCPMWLSCLVFSVLVPVSVPVVALTLLLYSPAFQTQVFFLHHVNWPSIDFGRPADTQPFDAMPPFWRVPFRRALAAAMDIDASAGTFTAIEDTSAHFVQGRAGRLGLWLTLPATASCTRAESNHLWILYLHGNALNRAHSTSGARVRSLSNAPFCAHVVQPDYRGFGDSDGVPATDSDLVEDALVAWEWLRTRTSARAAIYGHSLGSFVAVALGARLATNLPPDLATNLPPDLATNLPPEAPGANAVPLILHGAFASTAHALSLDLPFSQAFLESRFQSHFSTESAARQLHAKHVVLQIHGTNDSVVPIESARHLHAQLPGHKVWVEVEGGEHEDGHEHPDVRAALLELLRSERIA